MQRLLRAAERVFDIVIVDSAPLMPVADTLALRAHVGGFLVVARSRHTPREKVARAVSLLGEKRVFGVVLNGYVSHLPGSSRYKYAHKYGQHPGSSGANGAP